MYTCVHKLSYEQLYINQMFLNQARRPQAGARLVS